ncbi:MAG: transcription antitermination factor NusB [Porticoccus sp.]|jgi:N utilization substance protein B|nr:transcription antitermination factor NusB [Porticoccus sp.]
MFLPSTRKKARELLVQALYQESVSGAEASVIEAEFSANNNMRKVDIEFFSELLHGIINKPEEIDSTYTKYLDRESFSLDLISKVLLRIGSYELCFRIDIPYKVAINEAVNLAKKFGPTGTYKYVNRILDMVALENRAIEMKNKVIEKKV